MEIRKVLALRGPNIWANFPVLEAWVDLGELKDTSSEMHPRLQRAADDLAADDDRASLQHRRARRLLRTSAPRHLPGPHPRARDAGTADRWPAPTSASARPARPPRRASTRSSSSITRKTFGRACLAAAASSAWPPSTIGPSTSPPKSSSSAIWPTRSAWARAPARSSTAAAARGIPVRRLNTESLVQLGYGATAAPHPGRRDRPHRRHRRSRLRRTRS